jgi:RND family efflux transporter MFP subunit
MTRIPLLHQPTSPRRCPSRGEPRTPAGSPENTPRSASMPLQERPAAPLTFPAPPTFPAALTYPAPLAPLAAADGAARATSRRRRSRRGFRARLAAALTAAVAAVAAAGVVACSRPSAQDVETSDRVPVVTRPAVRGSIQPLVVATGTVRPAAGAELVVTAPQTARIAEMPKGVGDAVRRGDLLVRFDIPSLDADAGDRRSALASAEARLANARTADERIRGLYERGVAARKEQEDADRELADATAALAAARVGLEAAGKLSGRAVVRAPFAGVVAARGHNPGEVVDPGAPDPILRLVDPLRLQVEAAVPLAGLADVAVGGHATVTGPGAAAPEPATVLTRPAAVDSATATAVVRLGFTAPTRLPDGTPVRIEIAGPPHQGAVLVPAAALVQEGAAAFLVTVDAQGKAHRRPVVTGVVAGGQAEILSGIAPGDQVVVTGQNALPDGAATVPAPSGEAHGSGE